MREIPKKPANTKPSKTFDTIDNIFKRFMHEKFMNEKCHVRIHKDMIVFYVSYKRMKGFKMMHMIEISRYITTLAIEKNKNKHLMSVLQYV